MADIGDIMLRPARPKDSAAVACLWQDAFGPALRVILGEPCQAFLETWLARDPGLFANTTLACQHGQPVGYIQVEVRENKRRARVAVLCRLLLRHFGLAGGLKRLLQFWVTEWGHHYEAKDMYIFMLGVDARCRGQGVGRLLLRHTDMEARRLGKRQLQLGVLPDNHAAKRLYTSEGFRVLGYKRVPLLRWAEGTPGYEAMVKPITDAP